jgi:hypothetical protein
MAHGGKRDGAGRKAKEDEVKLIEKLTPLEPLAFAGKPRETKDITINEDLPLFVD